MEILYWAEVSGFKAELDALKPMSSVGDKLWADLRDRVTEHVRSFTLHLSVRNYSLCFRAFA